METKLKHKLLVTFELKPKLPLSYDYFDAVLIMKNIGDSPFPGGELTNFGVQFVNASQTASKDTLDKIPTLNPGDETRLSPHRFYAFESGSASLKCSIKANGGEQVGLYQNTEYDMGNNWLNVFVIKDSDIATVIDLLQQIVKLLKERNTA